MRDGNLDDLFEHENLPYPLSISDFGKLRFGVKSEIMSELESQVDLPSITPPVVVILIDGAALVNQLKPVGGCKTFQDYADNCFIPYINRKLQQVSRLDIVWDVYLENSIKGSAREKRGVGVRRRVEASVVIQSNWPQFLRIADNKTELFGFLAQQLSTVSCENKVIVSTIQNNVISSSNFANATNISPCNHEEADTRLFVHCLDVSNCDYKNVMIQTVDSDVVVLVVNFFNQLNLVQLWIAFGSGKVFAMSLFMKFVRY